MINYQFFPRSHGVTPHIRDIINCFKKVDEEKNENKHLISNEMLALVRPHLENLHFTVESGKAASNKINVPVLFGENDEIEKDTDMIIIYEPEKDFTENALLKLENFLVNDENYGKNLVYVPDIEGAEHTRLDSFVGMFGMSVTDGVAFEYDESRRYYSSNYYEYLICDFASNLYRENFSDERYTPVMTGLSRPIYIKSKDVEPLLVLSEKSGTVPYTADDDWSMEDSITGNICVMAQ